MRAQLTRAEGFFDLGMYNEAWNETEELPPIDRAEPLVLELRLRILTALSQWELGESVAKILVSSPIEPDKCRETCARFHHARARYFCETGDNESARLAMRAASDAWPGIRIEIVNDAGVEDALNGIDL